MTALQMLQVERVLLRRMVERLVAQLALQRKREGDVRQAVLSVDVHGQPFLARDDGRGDRLRLRPSEVAVLGVLATTAPKGKPHTRKSVCGAAGLRSDLVFDRRPDWPGLRARIADALGGWKLRTDGTVRLVDEHGSELAIDDRRQAHGE